MITNFLVKWNDGCRTLEIVSGPFSNEEKTEKIKTEVINMLKKIYDIEEEDGEKIYNVIMRDCHDSSLQEKEAIDLEIWENGASLLYGGGEEERIEVVEYDLPDNKRA